MTLENKTKKPRLKLGNIYEISLPNGKNAYGRLLKECTLAIYDIRCNSVSELPETEAYECYVCVYKDLLQDGEWKIVDNRPFITEEEAWPPQKCVVDAITKTGSLYYKGQVIPCSYDECKNLEIAAVWDRQQLIDRLMGDNHWYDSFCKPIAQKNNN